MCTKHEIYRVKPIRRGRDLGEEKEEKKKGKREKSQRKEKIKSAEESWIIYPYYRRL